MAKTHLRQYLAKVSNLILWEQRQSVNHNIDKPDDAIT